MVSISVRRLFHKPMDEKIKTWTLRFPAKENPNMEKALFDWPIVLQYDVKAKDPLISRKFSGMKFFYASVRLTNQKPRTFVSVRLTNQIALFPFVCCFCFVRAFSFQGHTKIALLQEEYPIKLWKKNYPSRAQPHIRDQYEILKISLQKLLWPLPLHGIADKITEGKSILRTPVEINEMSKNTFLKRLGEFYPWGCVRRGAGELNRYYKEFSIRVKLKARLSGKNSLGWVLRARGTPM